jgi:hypothetical protein
VVEDLAVEAAEAVAVGLGVLVVEVLEAGERGEAGRAGNETKGHRDIGTSELGTQGQGTERVRSRDLLRSEEKGTV